MSIVIKNLTFVYSPNTPYQKKALDNINLEINEGEFVGIIGHTGSGKSTFIQHLNGLIMPQQGQVQVFDITLTNAKKPKPDYKKLRTNVGMVFQYPEYQLFEETVSKDIAFGPKNLGLDAQEIQERVKQSMEQVGLDYEEFKDKAPFDLSGGQKRRVAIAGIIAMRPRVLILDEPTAGLDPMGKEQILQLIVQLKQQCSPTIIVISHDIDEISRFASRIVVFNDSKIEFDLPKSQLFSRHSDTLVDIGLDIPQAIKIANKLKEKGIRLDREVVNKDDLLQAIVEKYNTKYNTKMCLNNHNQSVDNKNKQNNKQDEGDWL